MFAICWLALGLGFHPAAPRDDAVTLADYAWMAGTWKAAMPNGDELEEIWSQPSDRDIMGVFRWRTAAGQPRFYEILVITIEAGKPVIRLRHMNPDFTAWEEKDKPVVFTAESASKEKVVFAQTQPAGSKARITYEKVGTEAFTVTLDRGDGRPLVMQFKKVK